MKSFQLPWWESAELLEHVSDSAFAGLCWAYEEEEDGSTKLLRSDGEIMLYGLIRQPSPSDKRYRLDFFHLHALHWDEEKAYANLQETLRNYTSFWMRELIHAVLLQVPEVAEGMRSPLATALAHAIVTDRKAGGAPYPEHFQKSHMFELREAGGLSPRGSLTLTKLGHILHATVHIGTYVTRGQLVPERLTQLLARQLEDACPQMDLQQSLPF